MHEPSSASATAIAEPATASVRRVDRAAAELRRGTPVLLHGHDTAVLVQATETAAPGSVDALRSLGGTSPRLALATGRAEALGLEVASGTSTIFAELSDGPSSQPRSRHRVPMPGLDVEARISETTAGDAMTDAAVALAKIARLAPVLLIASVEVRVPAEWARSRDLLEIKAGEVLEYDNSAGQRLSWVAEARVPLADAENTRLHAFRAADGSVEHLAIVIGEPRPGEAVLTRLHSECLTGDLLGSLRCDCGDQLRGAVRAIAETGAGVLLYLAQEGRGIGLVNKLRAYALQDRGADTLDANEALGYEADERVYRPAAEMLRQLDFTRVRLLTNNPDKVAALGQYGITVEERVPHHFPSNTHNAAYLATKARRFGHMS
ncbi:GTP cyclohydrolase II [Ferruginivarius sediminum]|uniref:GTP cyclohydrolase-2 n=1 Tax=Ferruginivarius sediminum TaxID=2661937 RepID=A0A369TD39_9PROT|nr:GTP cyclohydrolase II [Ferruginivarius sediminum]RDD63243.1 GTP cyclohydrolase II [Ferruginivarius sediminum]